MAKKQVVNPVAEQRKVNNGAAKNNKRTNATKKARQRQPNGRFK